MSGRRSQDPMPPLLRDDPSAVPLRDGGPRDASNTRRARARLVRQFPEAGRAWIALSPRHWRCFSGPWTDLANGALGGLQGPIDPSLPELEGEPFDDLLYLPPVDPGLRGPRDAMVEELAGTGATLLVQLVPGESCGPADSTPPDSTPLGGTPPDSTPPDGSGGVHTVYDLTGPLIQGKLDHLTTLPAGSTAIWPLIAGVTTPDAVVDEGLDHLKQSGVGVVLPLAVEIAPRLRRSLAEGRDDAVFDALFHSPTPEDSPFVRAAASRGLGVLPERPATGETPRQRGNRRLAAALALAGDLWLRLDRGMAEGQAILRSARGAETTPYDLQALAREGNLEVLDWLDGPSRRIIEEVTDGGSSTLLEELRGAYLRI